jgi:dTDP-glucose 4,6-dehydratase
MNTTTQPTTKQPHPTTTLTTHPTTLITGAAGFTASALIRELLTNTQTHIIAIDSPTPTQALGIPTHPRVTFVPVHYHDSHFIQTLLQRYKPNTVYHLATETRPAHATVDPLHYTTVNVTGTHTLLEATYRHWRNLPEPQRQAFRFIHGTSTNATQPHTNTPPTLLTASQTAANHLIQAYHHTLKLPTIIVAADNTFGARQHPKETIPQLILRTARRIRTTIHETHQTKNWLHITDYAATLRTITQHTQPGNTTTIHGHPTSTTELIHVISTELDATLPQHAPHTNLITLIPHPNPTKHQPNTTHQNPPTPQPPQQPTTAFREGIRSTVRWYLSNVDWVDHVLSSELGWFLLEEA